MKEQSLLEKLKYDFSQIISTSYGTNIESSDKFIDDLINVIIDKLEKKENT